MKARVFGLAALLIGLFTTGDSADANETVLLSGLMIDCRFGSQLRLR
jgi:hypothetical protein